MSVFDYLAKGLEFKVMRGHIVMLFKIMTQHCFVKRFKTEEKTYLQNTEMKNRLLRLDTT